MTEPDPPAYLWADVATAMTAHIEEGRAHLLTEDTLRFTTALTAGSLGIDPERIRFEWSSGVITGLVDLVVDEPPSVAVEFKFPRGSRTGSSPLTMILGHLVNDFIRLARLPVAERLAVQLIGDWLRPFLERRTEISWTWTPGETMTIGPEAIEALPITARQWLPDLSEGLTVVCRCLEAYQIPSATLAVYRVEEPQVLVGEVGPRLTRSLRGSAPEPPQEAETDLGRAFHGRMARIYERAERETGYRATRFMRMVAEQGGLETAHRLLRASGTSEGFTALWERGRLDLTVEWLILEPEYRELFSEQEREVARSRLISYGVPPAQLPPG